MHDPRRLVFTSRSGGSLPEVGRGNFQVQSRKRLLGNVADTEVDMADLSVERQFLDLIDIR